MRTSLTIVVRGDTPKDRTKPWLEVDAELVPQIIDAYLDERGNAHLVLLRAADDRVKLQPLCATCKDTGIIDTGNNDLPCTDCDRGKDKLFQVAMCGGPVIMMGAEVAHRTQRRREPELTIKDGPFGHVLSPYRKRKIPRKRVQVEIPEDGDLDPVD